VKTRELALSRWQRWGFWLVLVTLLLTAGCAGLPSTIAPNNPETPVWNGRMALKVENQPSQSFSTRFELKGGAQTGELNLISPLGSTLARLTWSPEKASLRTPKSTQDFTSLTNLIVFTTGSAIPVTALFDWLAGVPTSIEGWQVDLSRQPEGRLLARRADPATELRVVLDQP